MFCVTIWYPINRSQIKKKKPQKIKLVSAVDEGRGNGVSIADEQSLCM